ncbi:MAG: lipid-A-disaccharide synthase [Prevotellaceae bacterium]|jgi:lipid-A-disaccharide synthase|nr:lipid-A-disaccharide synthase [Prevotellaceae bacterium]
MKYFLIVGEASGDMHGAALMRELKNVDFQADFCFLGGDLMQAQGGKMVRHYREMAFMGIVNVLLNMRKITENFRLCKEAIVDFKPDVVILIDYPGFNLKIMEFVKKNLQTPVYYYIAPKLWAWKSYRIKTIKRYADKVFTIFPFETQYFRNLGYEVNYVGNPTVDAVEDFLQNTDNRIVDSEKPVVALLAGSRKQEIRGCLKIMSAMADYFPDFQFVAAAAPNIDESFYRKFLPENISLIKGNTYQVIKNSFAAVVNSGTATLETALLNTPQVVVYHVFGGIFVPILRKILIHIPFVSLVNLIAEKEVAKELITPNFTKEKLKTELAKILYDSDLREEFFADYKKIRQTLGEKGTAQRVAEKICGCL